MTPQDTMQLALEALEYASTGNRRPEIIGTAIEALKAALAQQPDADPNAPWMTEAHCLCSDHGIPHGNITERIRALRDKLAQQGEQPTEREACAQICEKYAKANMESDIMVEAFLHCAEAIRKSGT